MRAYIMGIIYLGAKIFYEERAIEKALIMAFIISSFINPYAIRSISYQMSYLALIGILYLYPKIRENIKSFISPTIIKNQAFQLLLVSFSIQIMLFPLFLYNFRVLPLFSFIPNLLVIPLGGVLVQLLFIGLFLSYLGVSWILLPLGYYLYRFLIFIIDIFCKIPFLTLNFYTKISLLLYIFLYVIILLYIILKKDKIKRYGVITVLIIPLIYLNLNQRKENLEFNFGYYVNSPNRILLLNKDLKIREIYQLEDNKIHKLDNVIIPYKMKLGELKKVYPNMEIIVLKNGEKIKLGEDIFVHKKNKIVREKDEEFYKKF
jgi:competence protein ComEC